MGRRWRPLFLATTTIRAEERPAVPGAGFEGTIVTDLSYIDADTVRTLRKAGQMKGIGQFKR